jgi:hypothetical protein
VPVVRDQIRIPIAAGAKDTETVSPTLFWHDDIAFRMMAFVEEPHRDVSGSIMTMHSA